jgi:hypothetical protein
MLNPNQLRELIIKPTLIDLIKYSEDAEELLLFTCCTETNGGTYLKQINGPALGIYQMEPKTYNDLWQNFINQKTEILLTLTSNFDCIRMPPEDRLIYDLRYATAMARLFYARIQEKIPSRKDLPALWSYYKRYYNSIEGSSERSKSVQKYLAYINK